MKKSKINFLKKTMIAGVLVLALVFSPISAPKANAFWGEFVQEGFHFVLAFVKKMVEDFAISAAQKMAISSLTFEVDRLMGGGGNGGAVYIEKWEDHLVSKPKAETLVYINDYLSQMTAGRNSLTGYASEGFAGSNNYVASLSAGALDEIRKMEGLPTPTYEGNPMHMFEGGSFKNVDPYFGGIINPWLFNNNIQKVYGEKLKETMEIEKTMAISYQGFLGTKGEDSAVTFPGSLVKDNIANVQNIPNLTLATADSVSKVITPVIANLLARMMNGGFQSTGATSQNNSSIQARMDSYNNSAVEIGGPEARFNTN